jgi:hypothetical protein
MINSWKELARVRENTYSGATNGGWAYDAYPELETLDAGRAITIAAIDGPAVITGIHSTQHGIDQADYESMRALYARGVILEIYFNDIATPAVRVPLGDFFADGCGGRARHFTSQFIEKAPESYNCFIPMPFERSARVMLVNETDRNISNYSFVEFERMPAWEPDLGYFHATWTRQAFQLHSATDQHMLHIDGKGHLVGRALSVATDEPFFKGFHFVMEGNNEFRIDGEQQPRVDYLGTEDAFGFSWGFRQEFTGIYNGINFVRAEAPSLLSMYRFHGANALRFEQGLDLRIDWSNEWKRWEQFQTEIAVMQHADRGWVDYAATYYWYQQEVGHPHADLGSLDHRARTILHPNPGQ